MYVGYIYIYIYIPVHVYASSRPYVCQNRKHPFLRSPCIGAFSLSLRIDTSGYAGPGERVDPAVHSHNPDPKPETVNPRTSPKPYTKNRDSTDEVQPLGGRTVKNSRLRTPTIPVIGNTYF